MITGVVYSALAALGDVLGGLLILTPFGRGDDLQELAGHGQEGRVAKTSTS